MGVGFVLGYASRRRHASGMIALTQPTPLRRQRLARLRFGLMRELSCGLECRCDGCPADLRAVGDNAVVGVLGGIDLQRGMGLDGGDLGGARKLPRGEVYDPVPFAAGAEPWRRNLARQRVATDCWVPRGTQEPPWHGRPAEDQCQNAAEVMHDWLHVEAKALKRKQKNGRGSPSCHR